MSARRSWAVELVQQGARFGIVGLVATLLHMAVAWTVNRLGVTPYAANALGFAAGFVIAYLGHFYWTFGRRGNHLRHQLRFIVVSAVSFALGNGVIWLVVDRLGLSFDLALVVIVLVVPPTSWMLSRVWAFRAPES